MRRRPSVAVAAALALILPVLSTPFLIVPTFSGRYLVIVVLATLSPALLGLLRVNRTPDAVVLAILMVWATIATLVADQPVQSLWGGFGVGTGLVFVLALGSAYVLGKLAGAEGTLLVERALLASLLANVVLGVCQVVFDLSPANLELYEGRATGFLGNPVFLGGLLAGGFWLALRHEFRRSWAAAVAPASMALGINLSGSRIAIAAMVLAVAGAATLGWRRALVAAGAGASGMAAGVLVAGLGDGIGRGVVVASSRFQDSSGVVARREAWLGGWRAFLERPVTGAGPGRFKAAVMPHRTLEFIQAEGPNAYFADAHNLVVEYAVTTGTVGVVSLVLWIGIAIRRGGLRTPLTGFASLMLLTMLAEPQHNAATPLAFLALGVAAGGFTSGPTRWIKPFVLVASIFGLAIAATLGIGFWSLNEARLDFDLAAAERANRFLPPWPVVPEQLARIHLLLAAGNEEPEAKEKALRYRRQAAAVDPADPGALAALADLEIQVGLRDAAVVHLDRALALDQWFTPVLNARALLAAEDGNATLAAELLCRSLKADPAQPMARALLSDIRNGKAGGCERSPRT